MAPQCPVTAQMIEHLELALPLVKIRYQPTVLLPPLCAWVSFMCRWASRWALFFFFPFAVVNGIAVNVDKQVSLCGTKRPGGVGS